jgi:hypothetical protein
VFIRVYPWLKPAEPNHSGFGPVSRNVFQFLSVLAKFAMAFRIQDSVLRGEIDNRVKGIVRGTIWLEGRAEPVELELKGNAHPDLAGCKLAFMNPLKPLLDPRLSALAPLQRGMIGDLTASRKVRVPDVPIEEFVNWPKEKGPPPEHMANCLYLEWFSEANGRVVIESPDYELTISAPEWGMTPEDEIQRAKDAAAGWNGFIQQLNDALEKHQEGQKDPEEDWDEHDYERFMKECDARTDKYMELVEKYGDSEDAEAQIAREMGWDGEDDADDADGNDGEQMTVEEMNRITEEALNGPASGPDPLTEGKDWIRLENGEIRHPLQYRCFESAVKFQRETDALGLGESEDNDLNDFIFEFQTTSVKLAGALAGIAEGRMPRDPSFTVAYLKRALGHLHKAQGGLEAVAPRKLLPDKMAAEARKELFEIREQLLRLMDEFRGRS